MAKSALRLLSRFSAHLPPSFPARRWGVFVRLLLLTVGGGAIGAWVYVNEPGQSPWLPPCLFHELTGLHCPGCGNTRALHALLHGDVAAALSYNLLFLPMVACVALLAIRPRLAGNRWLCGTVAGAVILFFVMRNLPWFPFTLLAP